jgi:protein-tyrosine phosphatase
MLPHHSIFNLPLHEFPLVLDSRRSDSWAKERVKFSFHLSEADVCDAQSLAQRLTSIVMSDNPPEILHRVCVIYDSYHIRDRLVLHLQTTGIPTRSRQRNTTTVPTSILTVNETDFEMFAKDFPFLCIHGDTSVFDSLDNDALFYPSLITPQVFLGSDANASSLKPLQQLGITHIINCAREAANHFEESRSDFEYLRIPIDDNPSVDITPYFETVHQFILRVVGSSSKGKILIHCHAGRSRSAAFLIYHIMQAERIGYAAALEWVQMRRPNVQPNIGFEAQLRLVEARILPSREDPNPRRTTRRSTSSGNNKSNRNNHNG